MNLIDNVLESLSNYKAVINQNCIKSSEKYVGFTIIGINSKINGVLKIYKYVLIYPFIGQHKGISYPKFNNLFLFDFCLSVDITFYNFIYNEMKTRNNILICSINEDNFSWNLSNGDSLINILHNNINFTDLSFEEWYEKEMFNFSDYIIEITNPDLYSVPFPLHPLKFSLNKYYDNYLKKK
jgi:hypothetical protein